jgi:pyruvate/2-oxoglutarate dehydrogenase complex dihydrolipoamide acyltransferase (E2) component
MRAMSAMTTRRKLAIATWDAPREGNIYGRLQLDAEEVTRFLTHVREVTGERVTITHFVGRVVGEALAASPGLNGFLRWGVYHRHATADVSFLVALEDGKDLAKVKVEAIDTLPMTEVARRLGSGAQKLRAGTDEAFEKSKGPIRLLPTWMIRPLVWLTGWLTGSLGISVGALGLERFPFGAAIVTSVGMLGVDEGYVPPTPFARVPLYVAVGAVRDMPAVVDGQLAVRKQVVITATLDHRFLDGAQGAVLARIVRERFADPWPLLGNDAPRPAAVGTGA